MLEVLNQTWKSIKEYVVFEKRFGRRKLRTRKAFNERKTASATKRPKAGATTHTFVVGTKVCCYARVRCSICLRLLSLRLRRFTLAALHTFVPFATKKSTKNNGMSASSSSEFVVMAVFVSTAMFGFACCAFGFIDFTSDRTLLCDGGSKTIHNRTSGTVLSDQKLNQGSPSSTTASRNNSPFHQLKMSRSRGFQHLFHLIPSRLEFENMLL
jgi:hypothetical protein